MSFQQHPGKMGRIIVRSIQHQLQKGTCQPGKLLCVLSGELASLIVVCIDHYCINWVTALGVKSYQESQSSSQKLCKLHPAKRAIVLHYKGCDQGQRGTCTGLVEQAQE